MGGTGNAKRLMRLIGYRIKFFRGRKGMTQADLARGIGITPGGLSQVEKGDKGLSVVNVSRAAEILGVPISIIMSSVELDDVALDALVNFFKLAANRKKSHHFDAINALIMADLKDID